MISFIFDTDRQFVLIIKSYHPQPGASCISKYSNLFSPACMPCPWYAGSSARLVLCAVFRLALCGDSAAKLYSARFLFRTKACISTGGTLGTNEPRSRFNASGRPGLDDPWLHFSATPDSSSISQTLPRTLTVLCCPMGKCGLLRLMILSYFCNSASSATITWRNGLTGSKKTPRWVGIMLCGS